MNQFIFYNLEFPPLIERLIKLTWYFRCFRAVLPTKKPNIDCVACRGNGSALPRKSPWIPQPPQIAMSDHIIPTVAIIGARQSHCPYRHTSQIAFSAHQIGESYAPNSESHIPRIANSAHIEQRDLSPYCAILNLIQPHRRGVSHTPFHQTVSIVRAYAIRQYGFARFSRHDLSFCRDATCHDSRHKIPHVRNVSEGGKSSLTVFH